jgi:hypothetical protein
MRILVSSNDSRRIDALTGAPVDGTDATGIEDLLQPPRHGLPGIFRGDDSWWALARSGGEKPAPTCREIELSCSSPDVLQRRESQPPRRVPPTTAAIQTVRIDVVDPERFQELGGKKVPPLNEANRYGGWRLP